jgi:hypothetical protein
MAVGFLPEESAETALSAAAWATASIDNVERVDLDMLYSFC